MSSSRGANREAPEKKPVALGISFFLVSDFCSDIYLFSQICTANLRRVLASDKCYQTHIMFTSIYLNIAYCAYLGLRVKRTKVNPK